MPSRKIAVWRHPGTIATAQPVPSNDKKIFQHLQGVKHRVDPALEVVLPENADFLDFHPLLAADEQQFDIEAEPVDTAGFEEFPGNRSPETFETALGVFNAGNRQELNEFVKCFPHENPVEWLSFQNPRFLPDTGTDGDIATILQGFHEFVDLTKRRRKIGIAKQNIFAYCGHYAGPDRISLSLVVFIAEEENLGMAIGKFADDFSGAVRTAIIDNNYFKRGKPSIYRSPKSRKSFVEPLFFIERRYDNRNKGFMHFPSLSTMHCKCFAIITV
jgi:hypothetical protein